MKWDWWELAEAKADGEASGLPEWTSRKVRP